MEPALKIRISCLILMALWIPAVFGAESNSDSLKRISHPYFGQIIPPSKPEAISSRWIPFEGRLHGFAAFSPDGREVFWPVIPPRILTMSMISRKWSPPSPAHISEGHSQAPVFSPDGSRLYFQSARKTGLGSLDIWYIEKTDTGWSLPINPGSPLNSPLMEAQPTITLNGVIYFVRTLENTGFNRGIFRFKTGSDQAFLLPSPINTPFIDMYPFIDSGERFLLFASSRPSLEEDSLRIYMSIRHPNDEWTDPVDLLKILDIHPPARFPAITPDGRFFMFVKGNSLYWMDSSFLMKILDEGCETQTQNHTDGPPN